MGCDFAQGRRLASRMTTVDYLVVGAGLSGSTVARILADHNREVLILERRPHVGGNVHDYLHPCGARVHTYGPHYFRCASPEIRDFVNRFAGFFGYRATVKSLVNGRYENWPLCRALLDTDVGWRSGSRSVEPKNFEEACLQEMPRSLYEAYVKNYTRRQWGVEPSSLAASLAERIRINDNDEHGLTPQYPYQGLPQRGYAHFMVNLVAGIPCLVGVDYLEVRSEYRARKALVFTGSIDEFFGFDMGHLTYRTQKRQHRWFPHLNWYQPCGQVNHPGSNDAEPLRTVEWKHLMQAEQQPQIRGTIITSEYPSAPDTPDQFEYPLPTTHNQLLYRRYRGRAQAVPRLIACGRLGEFCYLDMDQAIDRAMSVARRLCLESQGSCR
jgi:UDP-galactopyranose mutase